MATLKSIKNKYLQASDGETLGVDQNKDNVSLLAFKLAAADSIAKFDMRDGMYDTFADATGIDTSTSTNEIRNSSGKYYSGSEIANYWGDSSDGSLSTSANVTHTVQNKNGGYDGDMVIKQYSSLTINSGHTMTVDQPCRGMLIYVAGDCTINGTLSMDVRGAYANPTTSGGSDNNSVSAAGLQWPMVSASGTDTLTAAATLLNGCGTATRTAVALHDSISGNGTIFLAERQGANGGVGASSTTSVAGADGTGSRKSGGGGTGAAYTQPGTPRGVSGSGGYGSCFSGGSGGGGNYLNAGGGSGTNWGGPGGNGNTGSTRSTGGAGNPGGASGSAGDAGQNGTGGLLVLFVKGDLTIGASGSISAQGTRGGDKNSGTHTEAYGGGSGGGLILCGYGGNLSNSGSITVAGGRGGTDPGYPGSNGIGAGGDGGDGDTQIVSVVGEVFNDMTLVSNSTTAQAQPDTADLVLKYTNGAGTATINTDLKVYVSRDNGTTYTETTLVNEGTTGGDTILAARRVDISGQPSGTSMRYKVTTHNQSVAKETRIQAASLAWA